MAVLKVGEKLRMLREWRGLKQTDVAEHLHMPQQSYSAYETSQVKGPMTKLKGPIAKLAEFAKYYDVSLDWLVNAEIDDAVLKDKAMQQALFATLPKHHAFVRHDPTCQLPVDEESTHVA